MISFLGDFPGPLHPHSLVLIVLYFLLISLSLSLSLSCKHAHTLVSLSGQLGGSGWAQVSNTPAVGVRFGF